MNLPDSSLERLLSAFYKTENRDAFLKKAEGILNARLCVPVLNDSLERLPFSSSDADAPYPAAFKGAHVSCIDVRDEGLYACTVAADALLSGETKQALHIVASLAKQGIELHGWFGESRAKHPDLFLENASELGRGIYCLYVPADMTVRTGAQLCEELHRAANALHCYREKRGFALIVQKGETECDAFFASFGQSIAQKGLACGVAGPFASASLAKGCMEKAKEAAFFPPSSEPLRFVSRLRWSLFCAGAEQSVRREGFEIGDFLQNALKRVLAYDAENNTQYYDSMFQYLLCGKSLKSAAERLGVHRNTLDYRIGRMRELFGIDFDDRHTCFELLFSCRLIEETGCRP